MSHPALTDNNISTSEEHLSCSDLWRLPTIEQKFNCETTENWHQTLNSTLNAKKKEIITIFQIMYLQQVRSGKIFSRNIKGLNSKWYFVRKIASILLLEMLKLSNDK